MMQEGGKVAPKKQKLKRRKAKKRNSANPKVGINKSAPPPAPAPAPSQPQAPQPQVIVIKSNRGAALNANNNIPKALGVTAQMAPSDYVHIFNIEKAKQDAQFVFNIKQKLPGAVVLKVPAANAVAAQGQDNCAAPGPGPGPSPPSQPPAPAPPATPAITKDNNNQAAMEDQNVNNNFKNIGTVAIAPNDYVQIFAKDRTAKIVDEVKLKEAVNKGVVVMVIKKGS